MIEEKKLGMRIGEIGDDEEVLDKDKKRMKLRVIEENKEEEVKGKIIKEMEERREKGVEIEVMVEMIRVDIGEERDIGREFKESEVDLIGIKKNKVKIENERIGEIGVDDEEIDEGRVEMKGIEKRRKKGGCSSIEVGEEDGEREKKENKIGKNLGEEKKRKKFLKRGKKLRIVIIDRCRKEDKIGIKEIIGIVEEKKINEILKKEMKIRDVGMVREM